MSYSFSSLADAWDTPRDRFWDKRHNTSMRSTSPSPSVTSSDRTNNTIVLRSDSEPIVHSGYASSQTSSSDESGLIGDRNILISRSPSVELDSRPVIASGRGSPVSSLDTDDYESDSGMSNLINIQNLPGLIPGTHQRKLIKPDPDSSHMDRSMGLPGSPGSVLNQGHTQPIKTDNKMMKQILRIRDDVRQMLQSKSNDDTDFNYSSFPLMETGLFIAIGLFVLLAMHMMTQLKPNTIVREIVSTNPFENLQHEFSKLGNIRT